MGSSSPNTAQASRLHGVIILSILKGGENQVFVTQCIMYRIHCHKDAETAPGLDGFKKALAGRSVNASSEKLSFSARVHVTLPREGCKDGEAMNFAAMDGSSKCPDRQTAESGSEGKEGQLH